MDEYSVPPLPSYLQFIVSTLLLLGLSAVAAPLSFTIALYAWLRIQWSQRTHARGPIVLMNGAKMYKSLGMVRAFGKAGYRVILVEAGRDATFAHARLSRYISFYSTVSAATPGDPTSCGKYVAELCHIAASKNVDLFVPCSGAGTTIEDAKAAELMRERSNGKLRTAIPSPRLTTELHEKDRFMDLLGELGVHRPRSTLVSTAEEAMDAILSCEWPSILKATAVLDDLGRNDMTCYPLKGDQAALNYPLSRRRLNNGLAIPITPKTPYVVQEFVQGVEICTHATIVDGRLMALVVCESTDMLMRYEALPRNHPVTVKARRWTTNFLEAWARSRRFGAEVIQGHLSMDFILSAVNGELYPIECNPRIHTAICLISDDRTATRLANVYLNASTPADEIVEPREGTSPKVWWPHELISTVFPKLLPALARRIHPYAIPDKINQSILSLLIDGQDPTWDWEDPWPFFGLYHIQWPHLLLKQLISRRKRWVRINASTSRIFEAP